MEVTHNTTPEEWFSRIDSGSKLAFNKMPMFVNNRFWREMIIPIPEPSLYTVALFKTSKVLSVAETYEVHTLNRPDGLRLIRVGKFGTYITEHRPVPEDRIGYRRVDFKRRAWKWPDRTEHSSYELFNSDYGLSKEGDLIYLLER